MSVLRGDLARALFARVQRRTTATAPPRAVASVTRVPAASSPRPCTDHPAAPAAVPVHQEEPR